MEAARRQVPVLLEIAPLLPLPVPRPILVGTPSAAYRWPFLGHERLSGGEPAERALTDDDRARAADPLGRFLRALHAARPEAAAALPVDPIRRGDMRFRVERTRARIVALEEAGLWAPPAGLAALLDEAERLPVPPGRVLCHGDLHLRHLLVADDGTPSAVIDWDDVCLGDPGIDLPLYWCLLPPGARPAFLAAYGDVSEEALLRGRVLAVFLAATLALYGRHEGMPALAVEALAALDRALRD